ncbi:MAG: hypothetical protein WCK15_22495, partial [Pirellula sp.]
MSVIPAQAGTQLHMHSLDSRLRGNDVLVWLMGLAWLMRQSRKPLSLQRCVPFIYALLSMRYATNLACSLRQPKCFNLGIND